MLAKTSEENGKSLCTACLQLLRRLAICCVQAAETKTPEGKLAAVKALKSESSRIMMSYTHVPEGVSLIAKN